MQQSPLDSGCLGTIGDGQVRGRVLVVDDEKSIAGFIAALLQKSGHETRTAASGAEALAVAATGWPDLVLLDLVMAGMDGFETARRIKRDPRTAHVPIIMVTVLGDRDSRLRGLEIGAEDFLTKPIDPAELVIRVRNLLRLKEYGDFLSGMNALLERQVRRKTDELRGRHIDTIFALAHMAEIADTGAARHIARIANLARATAEMLGMASGYAESIFYASALHDVGKLRIPAEVLSKPGPLSDAEAALIRLHPAAGAELLTGFDSPFLDLGAEIAVTHHECWDGSGYPAGLSGESIPLSGRIVLLCDRYDALRSRRPYKQPVGHEESVRRLNDGDSRSQASHFDPAVLAAFNRHNGRFEEIFEADAAPG